MQDTRFPLPEMVRKIKKKSRSVVIFIHSHPHCLQFFSRRRFIEGEHETDSAKVESLPREKANKYPVKFDMNGKSCQDIYALRPNGALASSVNRSFSRFVAAIVGKRDHRNVLARF